MERRSCCQKDKTERIYSGDKELDSLPTENNMQSLETQDAINPERTGYVKVKDVESEVVISWG
jgi:hypothetical protein